MKISNIYKCLFWGFLSFFCLILHGQTTSGNSSKLKPLNQINDSIFAFPGLTQYGDTFHLNEFKGKWILMDFWASWCAPCRKLSPRLIELHKKYQYKGLNIVGIAVEKNSVKWRDAIQKDQTGNWPQILDSNFANTFNVTSLPSLILIDPNGKIVERFGGMYSNRNKLEARLKIYFNND